MTTAKAQPPLGPKSPASPRELFIAFTQLALQGFGGVLSVSQHMLVVRKQWLSTKSYAELLTIAQVLPGPNVVNLCLIVGDRTFGWRGALAALAGMLCVPLLIVLALAALYVGVAHNVTAAAAMRGMAAVASGLVLGSALRLLAALKGHVHGPVLCGLFIVATLAALVLGHWPLAAVVLGIGGCSVTLAWWRLARSASEGTR